MEYEAVIGLEVHAQLKTRSKIFCACPTDFGAEPNMQVCPVCLGMPGVLPVLNKKVLEYGIKCGIALNCQINEESKFDRKNYFYPDLPKAYQISQFDQPICKSGYLTVAGRKIGITRAHLEEDAGKLVHAGAAGLHGSDYSLADFNRAGVPLLEIVSEPDLRSPEEARLYLSELRTILRYLDVCDGNLEEGSFRCDANVSIRPHGQEKLGTKAEIKNMNSFKAVQRAIQSEIDRQIALLERGERVVQETRLWNEATQSTFPMRSKEEAHDYRYFPEPDLPPLLISKSFVEALKATLPELPEARRRRYIEENGLSQDDAVQLVENKELADFYDQALNLGAAPKQSANLLLGPCMAYLNESKRSLSESSFKAQNLKDIVESTVSGILNSTTAKQILLDFLGLKSGDSQMDVLEYIKSKGLAQISDPAALKAAVDEVLSKNPRQLEDYRAGKVKIRGFFFGELMKVMKGKANPELLNQILDEALAEAVAPPQS
ncbi:MAG: Asp-tRNA(Asn)/Glu-tRNA(Gln) amidotransferase subunit GatB [Candidatus Obscuribacterales bacterium]|nr:Asp-tRNA(Asn)/Glu-tRNA(Gln) amidotransferase subunit GatB [Candidatus Obscuribacterales bacterium]